MSLRCLLVLLCVLPLASGCKKQETQKKATHPPGEAYFSVREFVQDQFRTFWGQPFTLERVIVEDGEKDSSMVSTWEMDWARVIKPFMDADISDQKFLDQYSFSVLNDDITVSRTYYYEALKPELFTRNLQIITDPFTNKIRSIFMETEEDGRFSHKTQKLYYVPVKLIQIQEFESPLIGSDRNFRADYRFLY